MRIPTRSVRSSAAVLGVALALSACGGGGETDGGSSAGTTEGALAVTGTDALKFEPSGLEAEAGEVTVELTCEAQVAHNFVVEETDDKVAECNAGATDTGTVELEAGDYTFYCDLPGHRAAGMEGTLTVA
ncbi:MAG: cupredoxin domain-containing protein [Actinobacteria bacterium]|nr:cupredoxin domain-containing protein [Actinomycetota bacterium]